MYTEERFIWKVKLPPNSPSPMLSPSCSFAMSSSQPPVENVQNMNKNLNSDAERFGNGGQAADHQDMRSPSHHIRPDYAFFDSQG